jgi:acyl-CoA thioesterase-1
MGPSLNRRHFIALGAWAASAGLSTAQSATPKPHTPTLLVVGDSLSAEYGLKRGTGWVALMEQRLAQEKITAQVVNASISGDTTAGGRSRLPALLTQHKPTVVIIELGGNDALRGLPLQMTQDNLQAMTRMAQAAGAKVMLIGMQVPPNYGQDYAQKFAATFVTVAKAGKATLVPFLLKNVADGPNAAQLFQNDRIHPNEAAHPLILNNVWPTVKKLIA